MSRPEQYKAAIGSSFYVLQPVVYYSRQVFTNIRKYTYRRFVAKKTQAIIEQVCARQNNNSSEAATKMT